MRAIRGYRLRALLTMLGVSVGIFTITLVFTLVNTMQSSVTENLSALGNTVLYVHNWPWKDNSEDWYKYFNRPKMSYADYQRLQRDLRFVHAVCFEARKNDAVVKTGRISAERVMMRGVTQDFYLIEEFGLSAGRYFSPLESQAGRPVCILGNTLAVKLFGGPSRALGQHVLVAGKRLRVIGCIEKRGANLFGVDQDENLLVPYLLMGRLYNITKRGVDKIVSVKAASYEQVDRVEEEITGLLRLERGLKPGVDENFSINKQESLMEQLNKIFEALNVGGSFIAGFSLLVGGFGIANIMFVSVKERTKEIGIQKALGATRSFILMQFLTEAVLLCVLGGLMGIFGLLVIVGLGQLALNAADLGMTIAISARDIAIGVFLSAVIGLLSGLLPAWSAARLDPVEAMRAK